MTQTITRKHALTIRQFAEMCSALEKQVCCPNDQHSFKQALIWMRAHHVNDLQINLEKFVDLAVMCDCDLLEVLTDEQWEAEREKALEGPAIHGQVKWNEAILGLLLEAQ